MKHKKYNLESFLIGFITGFLFLAMVLTLSSCNKDSASIPKDNYKLVFSNYQAKSTLQEPTVWVEYNHVPTEFIGNKTISWFSNDTQHYKISVVTTQCTVEVQLYIGDKLIEDTLVQTSKIFEK